MASVPIFRLGSTLIATVQEDMNDGDALSLQANLAKLLEIGHTNGVLLDISVLGMVDSFLGRLINDIASMARLMGSHTVVVGMQPAVAITLVELGLELRGVRTALTAEKGLALLQRLTAAEVRLRHYGAR